jgi:glycosidase
VEQSPAYDTRRPTPAERRVQQLVALFQFTYVGAPMIYYGDEAGMWGANDPCCRKPMVWPDAAHDAEATLPDGEPRDTPDEVAFDRELFDYYRKLIAMRKASPALRIGDYRTLLADDGRRLFAFARESEGDTVIAIFNADELMHTVELAAADGEWVDLLSADSIKVENGLLRVTLPPVSGAVYRRVGI